MKSEYFVYIALMALVALSTGCAGLGVKEPRIPVLSEQQRSLAGALEQLRAGREHQARDLLKMVVDGVPMAGVTDEAFFRLALLSLKEDGGKGIVRAQELLERLADKYPDSIWTKQSASLLSHLIEARMLRNQQRELKNLKEHNVSLSRDNRELRQTLEQLKQLDLDLDQRIKR